MTTPNPYAAPQAGGPLPEPSGTRPRVNAYEAERRSVVVCILLTLVSLGFYPGIWLMRRRAFVNHLDASSKLAAWQAHAYLATGALGFVFAFGGPDGRAFMNFMNALGGIALLVANFRVASILESDFRRSGRFLSVSRLLTFFFGLYYLQYKINCAASTPARVREEPAAGALPSR